MLFVKGCRVVLTKDSILYYPEKTIIQAKAGDKGVLKSKVAWPLGHLPMWSIKLDGGKVIQVAESDFEIVK